MRVARTVSFFLILLMFSCEKRVEKKESEALINKENINLGNNNPIIEKDNKFSFLDGYTTKKIPLTDSTGFDNFKRIKELSKEQVELLHLNQIIPKGLKEYVDKFSINYNLKISDNFRSLVISYSPNDNELYTTLVNYDSSYNLINSLIVAYDEVAEGWFRTISIIDQDEIQVKEISYMESNPETKITNYKITKEGEIVLVKKN